MERKEKLKKKFSIFYEILFKIPGPVLFAMLFLGSAGVLATKIVFSAKDWCLQNAVLLKGRVVKVETFFSSRASSPKAETVAYKKALVAAEVPGKGRIEFWSKGYQFRFPYKVGEIVEFYYPDLPGCFPKLVKDLKHRDIDEYFAYFAFGGLALFGFSGILAHTYCLKKSLDEEPGKEQFRCW